MKILITAATQPELDAVNSSCREGSEKKHTIDLLVTGLGAVATAYNLAKALTNTPYDLVLNIGIAGSFSQKHPVGEVVVVSHECFADLGVTEECGFKTAFDMNLLSPNSKPFTAGWLSCPYPARYPIAQKLPTAKAITINTVTGTKERLNELRSAFNPDIESMEGAAFFYVCLCEEVPFLQIRSISNMVGVRDKTMWNIPLALKNLGKVSEALLSNI